MSAEITMLLVWLLALPVVFISLLVIYPRYLRWRVSSSASRTRDVSRVRPYRDG